MSQYRWYEKNNTFTWLSSLYNPFKRQISRLLHKFFDIQATIECEFTLKRICDMTRTYSQMHRTDKYSEHSSFIWSVWLNGYVFVYELSGSEFKSSLSYLNFRFLACVEQGVPWHSGNYRVWIHSKICMWHDKHIQSNAPYR